MVDPVNRILGDSWSRNNIIQLPIEQAWEMRKRQSIVGSMEQKRTPETMNKIKGQMLRGYVEPINATPEDLKEGRLQDGKHRLIVAKQLGMKYYPIRVM